MVCPPVGGDNPPAIASVLSHVQVDNHGITISFHLHHIKQYISKYEVDDLISECPSRL